MYSIRPHSSENIEFDLPTTMYSVQPVIQQTKQSTNELVLKDIEQRQDILLEKIGILYNQLTLYQNSEKVAAIPIREELVVHLSAKQPSKNILDLIEQFQDKLSIRTFRHSSLRGTSFNPQLENSSSSSNNRSLTIIWSNEEELPFMFHSNMKITDEQAIVNLISHQLINNN